MTGRGGASGEDGRGLCVLGEGKGGFHSFLSILSEKFSESGGWCRAGLSELLIDLGFCCCFVLSITDTLLCYKKCKG